MTEQSAAPEGFQGAFGQTTASPSQSVSSQSVSSQIAQQEPTPSLFSLAEAEAPAQGSARPEWLPEQFWDEAAKAPKLEALAKSWSDLRTRIARAGEDPPPSPSEYRLPDVDKLPEALKPTADDPVWQAVRENAHKAGVTQKQLEAIVTPYLAHLAAEAAARQDPQALRAAYETELARLGPNGKAMVREVGQWLKGLEARGYITADERAAAEGISTAEGVRLLAKLRAMTGEKPIPLEALDGSAMSYEDARRMMREAIAKRDERLGEQAKRALAELARRGAVPPGI